MQYFTKILGLFALMYSFVFSLSAAKADEEVVFNCEMNLSNYRKGRLTKIYDELGSLEEEIFIAKSEREFELADYLLEKELPEVVERAIAELRRSGLNIVDHNGELIVYPDSQGVYGRLARQLLDRYGILLKLDIVRNIRNGIGASIILSNNQLNLPVNIVRYPDRLSYEVYHELRHLNWEADRANQLKTALRNPVRFVPPQGQFLKMDGEFIEYPSGFLIEELETYKEDMRMLNSLSVKKNPFKVGLNHRQRSYNLEISSKVHRNLFEFSWKSLYRIYQVLDGSEKNYRLRYYEHPEYNQYEVALSEKTKKGERIRLKLRLDARFFKSPKTKAGRTAFKKWVRAVLVEMQDMHADVEEILKK